MSSTILNIIATTPSFVPAEINIYKATSFLSSIYNINQIKDEITDNIEFIDQGQNFENVSCNLCGEIIAIATWQDAMEHAYDSQFNNLSFVTTCCGQTTSLNDLNYKSPAGFAKFTISVIDPERELTTNEILKLTTLIGVNLRMIWAHY